MASYIFTNILGSFVFDDKFKIIDSGTEKTLKNKHKDLKEPDEKDLKKILKVFKNNRFFKDFYKNNLSITKKLVSESVSKDQLIKEAIKNIDDLEKVINILTKRLRDWYSLHAPEFSGYIEDNEKFCELITSKSRTELLKEIRVDIKDSMGKDLPKKDLKPIKDLASEIDKIFNLKNSQEEYIKEAMKELCPNLLEIAGPVIGARLIEEAGSLKHLSLVPASTIQLYGAEKALFRHIRNKKNKSPKFGLIFNHPYIQKNIKNSGKAARVLADKISIAVKVDYFNGKFIGDKLVKDLEAKFR